MVRLSSRNGQKGLGEILMLKITFKYRDEYSHGEWRTQTCCMSSVSECIKVYGLGVDCDYEIVSVEEVSK